MISPRSSEWLVETLLWRLFYVVIGVQLVDGADGSDFAKARTVISYFISFRAIGCSCCAEVVPIRSGEKRRKIKPSSAPAFFPSTSLPDIDVEPVDWGTEPGKELLCDSMPHDATHVRLD